MSTNWLPRDFAHPLHVDWGDGIHLRPIRASDVGIDMPVVLGNRDMLWEMYGAAWGWPPAAITAEQDVEDLQHHADEMERHESFNYAILPSDESELFGCVYIDPVVTDEADRIETEVSWWVTPRAPERLQAGLGDRVLAWIGEAWPFTRVHTPFNDQRFRATVGVERPAGPRARAEILRAWHDDPEILILTNVWDAASAAVIARLPETRALATASHAVAAAHGFDDGERIPLSTMIEAVREIAAVSDLPLSVDLEGGYGDVDATVRRAIEAGAVGGNIEDAMRPLAASVAQVAAAVHAGEAEGVPFVLNARTDALLGESGASDDAIDEAILRGREYLEAGASCVFVPGPVDQATAVRLVEGIGLRKVSVLGTPTSLSPREYERLGIARISYGPWLQRAALTAVQDAARALHTDGSLPEGTRLLP